MSERTRKTAKFARDGWTGRTLAPASPGPYIDRMATTDDYGDTLEAQILADYVTGGMTMIDACAVMGIPLRTNYDRINSKRNPKFMAMMEAARTEGYDAIANGIRKVARGEEGFSSGDVKRDRLIAEMDSKLLAKWHPKKYGEKIEIEQKSANVAIPVGNDPIAAQRAYEQLLKG